MAMLPSVVGAFAQFERELIRERQRGESNWQRMLASWTGTCSSWTVPQTGERQRCRRCRQRRVHGEAAAPWTR